MISFTDLCPIKFYHHDDYCNHKFKFINPPFDQCATYFFIIIHSNKVLVEVLLLLTALAHVSHINSSEYKKVSNKSITKTKNSSLDRFRLFSFVFDALLFIGQKS